MIDKDTKELLEIAAYIVTIGEGLTQVGNYIAKKVKKKRSQASAKPSKQRKTRKRK